MMLRIQKERIVGTHILNEKEYFNQYGLDYKKGIGDETTKGTPPDEFGAIEARPYQVGKNEVELDFDDVDIDDAISDLTELENFAKKKK